MIGHIQGEILFSDGSEIIVLTASGVGYQMYFNGVLPEGHRIALYTSPIIREASQELYAFRTLREKKLFELLITVKGIGPKSAFALMAGVSVQDICQAIAFDQKKTLTAAPGVGPKAAAQIILDLQSKIHRVMMFGDQYKVDQVIVPVEQKLVYDIPAAQETIAAGNGDATRILQDTIMACKELGFKEEKIIPIAQRIMSETSIDRAEQLVHLVLKGL